MKPQPQARRRVLATLLSAGAAGLWAPTALAQRLSPRIDPTRALREMRIHKVPELGLEIWLENQPPWAGALITEKGRPIFTAQSPDAYHPPSAMTFATWPGEAVPQAQMSTLALTAIRSAATNFGLNAGQARGVAVLPAQYGVLQGSEGEFAGYAQGVDMDVRVFVGRQGERFPLALSIYTLRGKMPHLEEVVRRCWGSIAYLS